MVFLGYLINLIWAFLNFRQRDDDCKCVVFDFKFGNPTER